MAFEVFELFHVIGDETVFDLSRAIEVVRAYGDRRMREALARPPYNLAAEKLPTAREEATGIQERWSVEWSCWDGCLK